MDADARNHKTLLERLGGEASLNALVGAFYFGVLTDERLAAFFADKDIEALLRHQRSFFAAVLGTDGPYRGRDLGLAHRELVERHGLDATHFDAIVEVLSCTLQRLGHAESLRLELLDQVARLRDQVLGTRR